MTVPPNPPPGAPYSPSTEERNWALAAHVGTLVAAWFAMGFLCPLVVMLVKARTRRSSVGTPWSR